MGATEDVITNITGGTLGATVVAAGARLWLARSRRRERIQSMPETRADSSVQRAQSALMVMEGALQAATRRAEVAEAEARELRQQIDQLEAELADIKQRLDSALSAVSELRRNLPQH